MVHKAIRVQGLGKEYQIGQRERGYTTFREAVSRAVTAPFRRLRELSGSSEPEGSFWALKDVSFDVEPGEVVGIIGRNGAGKSTLLKILSQITEPTTGEITLNGRVASLLEVGTGFHPELTGRENIYLNGSILGMRRAEIKRKFDEIVAFAEVEKFLDTPVKRYSSGMYVRLAFAVAAHLEPEILIIDEVLAVGDAAFQKKCLGKMGEVARDGRTVLFVSHNMAAVEQLCSSALLLRNGHAVASSKKIAHIINKYSEININRDGSGISSIIFEDERFASEWFRPKNFRICDKFGTPVHSARRNDDDTWIQINFSIDSYDPALTIGYSLFTEQGTLIYRTDHTDGPSDQWPKIVCGENTLRTQLPNHFLNEGHYRIALTVTLYHRTWLIDPHRDSPSLALEISGGLSRSPHWTGRREGIMAPVLSWI